MTIYRIQAPNGLTYQIEGPEGATKEEVAMAVMAKSPEAGTPFKEASASFGDTATSFAQSAVGTAKATLQGFGAEAPGVETLGNLQKSLGRLYTPERQAEQARLDALEKAAAKSGSALEEVKAGIGTVTAAPIQSTASVLGSVAPTAGLAYGAYALGGAAAVGLGLVGLPAIAFAGAVASAATLAFGALQGAGSVKGSIYDKIKENVAEKYPDLSKEEVATIARKAQDYTGENWKEIAAAGGIGAIAGKTGIEKGILNILGRKAGEKVGEEVAKKGIIAGTKRATGAGFKEAIPEAIQGSEEQYATNVAQTRAGFETPAMEGVLGAGAKEGTMGFLGGAAVSPFTSPSTTPTQPPVDPTGQPTPNELEAQVQQRRLARQQEQMGVKEGREAREGEKLIDAEAKAEADQQQLARVEAEKAAATELQALRAQRQAELEQTFPKDYSDVMQKTDSYAELFQEKQALLGQTKTKEVKSRIKTVTDLMIGIAKEDTRVPTEFARMQKENAKVIKTLPPELQAKYAAVAFTLPEPQQMEMRAFIDQPPAIQQTDLMGQPIQQEVPAPPAPDTFKTVKTAQEAQAALDAQNRREARAGQAERNAAKDAGQLGLFNRVGTPTAEAEVLPPKIIVQKPPVTEPTVRQKPTPETVDPVVTSDTLGVLGIGPTAVMRKPGHAIQGLDITKPEDAAEVKNMLTIYKEGRSPAIVEKIDTFLGRPEFEAVPAPTPKVEAAPVTEAPKVETPVAPKNAGYHAGDLGYGKDTTLGKMAGGRSTGHFGTGVYFVGSPDNIPAMARGDRPVNTVDLAKYNLAKPRSSVAAGDLHEGLKAVNSLVGQDLNNETAQGKINDAAFKIWANAGSKASEEQVKTAVTNAIQEATTARTDDVIFESTYVDSASTRVMKALGFEGVDVRNIPGFDNTEFGTVVYAPSLAPAKPTGQSAEKKAANKAAQPSAKKAKAVEAPPAPAPIKVVKKTEPKKVEPKKIEVKKAEPKKVEPKKVEVKKSEPKKLEAPKVEPKKEEPKVDKALEKARETVDDLDLDPETTKTKVKSFAKRLHKAGLIDDISLNAVESISKDKDMGYEDLLDEIRFALEAYESNQKKAPEAKPEAKKVTDESNIIEGETRVIPNNEFKLLEGPVNRLQDDQVEELEDFYGVKKDNPEFWVKLRADVAKSINEGSKAVAKAIREIVNQIASGVLAVGLIFNPNAVTNQYNINIQKTFQETISITAPVPEVAKSKMSPLAQDVYGAMAPVAMKTGKWFMVADKPNGMLHIFKEDGSHALSDPTLYGKDKGDTLAETSSLAGGAKVTPAGKFTLQESPDVKFVGNTTLILVESKDSTGYIAVHAADTSTPSENRLGRLDTETTEDNRISYGCINTKHDTFVKKIKPNIDKLDGGLIFVLPDATETTAEMFKPETKVVERTETPTTAKSEAKADTLGREQGLPPKEPTRARITDDQNPVDNPISNADLEGIVADVKKSLGGEVEVTILDSAKDLDSKAPAGAAGLVRDGNVYLFRDGIKSGIEGAKTVFHELFHLGLQKLLPNSKEYHRVMINLYRMNARVREMADKWIASKEGQDAKADYAKEYSNVNDQLNALTAHGTDEALARIAEELKTGKKIGTGQRAFVRSIAKWLADVAEKVGLRQVAQRIRSATYTEVEKFVQEAMTAAVGAGPVNIRLTRRFSVPGGIDENTRRAIQDIQDKTPAEYKEQEKKSLVQVLKSVASVENLRQKAADKYATVNTKVNQMYSKGFKNAFGDLNPMVLARQAEEARKLVLDFFKAGGIRMRKSGLIETVDTKDSLQNAIEQLVDLASKSDMTYEKAESYVSSLLEGHRLHNMREEHDKLLEASALTLEQQGKNKLADAERKKKLARHMDNADIDTLEAAFQKSPEVKAILNTLNATRTQAIDLSIATGRITKEQGQFWKDNAAYVPFDRVYVETEGPVRGRGFTGIAALRNLPGMKGSFERPIKNVFDSYTGRLSWMVTEAVHNHASYNVLDTMALGGFAKELTPGEVSKKPKLVVKVYREGKPVEFEVESEADHQAFQMAPEVLTGFTAMLAPGARWLRVGVTAFPAFSVKQVIEDSQRAMFNSGVTRPLVVGMKTLYNFPRLLTSDALQALGVSKKMPLVRMMEKLGIIGDYDVNIINPAQDIKIAAGAEKRGIAAKVYHVLEKITKASDLAARLAVFEETLLETGGKKDKNGDITGGDVELAQLRARELINFSRRGSSPKMRTLSHVVPFMNAYAQGMDVTYRTASGLDSATGSERMEARKQFYKMAMKLTALGFMYALAFGDDEGYKNAPDEVRDNNFLIPYTDKKIPLPKEIGFLFKSIPERLVNYYRRYGTDEEQTILNLLGSVVYGGVSAYGSPNVTPALIKPALEALTNHSFFLQRELESASMRRLDPSQRSTSSTSELAKAIGALSQKIGVVEVSPIKVDNLLRGLFGIAGSSTLLLTDALINPSRPDRPLYQMPFASLFLYNTEGGRAKNEFYDLQNKVSQADATYKNLKQNSPEKALDYLEKNEALITVAPILNSSLQQLSKTRKLRQQLETMSDEQLGMTSKERRQEIDRIIKDENDSLKYVRYLDKQVRDLNKSNKANK